MLTKNFCGIIGWHGSSDSDSIVIGVDTTGNTVSKSTNSIKGQSALYVVTGTSDVPLVSPKGPVTTTYGNCVFEDYKRDNGKATNYYLNVGTGDTAENDTDYNLDTPQTTLTASNPYINSSTYGSTELIKVFTTFENTTNSDVVVKEVGLFTGFYQVADKNFMLARKVLDNPITIHPNESYTFSYAITI